MSSNKPSFHVETSDSSDSSDEANSSSTTQQRRKRVKIMSGDDGDHTPMVAQHPSALLDIANKSTISHSNFKGDPNNDPIRSRLRDLCHANKWKLPLYECCHEEGPPHRKKFTFKVTLEIEGNDSMVLECFGASRPSRKKAAAHAAEGALWYLSHLGYLPKTND